MAGFEIQSKLIDHSGGTEATIPRDRSEGNQYGAGSSQRLMLEMFEQQVETTPERIAVISGEQHLTYAELNRRANQLAHYLKKSGVTLEIRVGVCLERSSSALIALLGIFKAGGAYIPLDPDYPAERLKYMLTDSQVTVILTSKDIAAKLPSSPAATICLDETWSRIEQEAADNPERTTHGENLAYVIYTSGSTGNPKGVMVDHRGLGNVLTVGREKFGFNQMDVMPCLASFSFDISLFELCNPLCAGGTVVIWDQKDVLDIQLLIESLEGLTLLHCVTTLMRQVVNWMKENHCRAHSLRQVFVGGEVIGVNLLDQMREVFPRAEVHAMYGPTEATMICASIPVTNQLTAPPIGTAIENMELHLLDHELKLSPAGTVGELYLGGAGLARGYLNRPALTAERFIPDCFSQHRGERLYRTGDLARRNSDGNLEFVGRADQQVKIHGHRIELGEIEATLERCRGVTEAVVTVREDQPGQQRLVAYVVAESRGRQEPASPQGLPWVSPALHDYAYDLTPITSGWKGEAETHPFYQAIIENVRDKSILIVGTNQEELLLKACVEGGAKRIYLAVCSAEEQARTERSDHRSNFGQVVPFLLGEELPAIENRIDICMSDLLGDIGGSKGLEVWLQQLRPLFHAETIFYPQECVTYLSAVELPESMRVTTEFHGRPLDDARQIFGAVRYPFDLRVRVHQLPPESLISEESVFEQITLSDPHVNSEAVEHQFQFTISRSAMLCGFVLTLKLFGDLTGRGRLDCCYATNAPAFLPVFFPGRQVESGDRIEGRCISRLSTENPRHLDYGVEGRILFRQGGVKSFCYRLPFIQRVFQGSAFYKNLFASTPIQELLSGRQQQDTREIVRELRDELKSKLPDYMLPSAIVKLGRFPLTPNGKIDRQALPAPEYSTDLASPAPVGQHQEVLCALFAEALSLSRVSPDDSFFDLGGNSVILIHLVKRIRDVLGINLSIRTFFDAPSVAGLTERLQLNTAPIAESVLVGAKDS